MQVITRVILPNKKIAAEFLPLHLYDVAFVCEGSG